MPINSIPEAIKTARDLQDFLMRMTDHHARNCHCNLCDNVPDLDYFINNLESEQQARQPRSTEPAPF